MDQGAFPLTSVAALPNVTVAFPGEHWSNRRATEEITPGTAVMPVNSGGKLYVAPATTEEAGSRRLGIALRTVQVPDPNTGPDSLGPNEIMNTPIPAGEYVHVWMSGGFHLTLVEPREWLPADLVTWADDGDRPAGKDGTGSWVVTEDEDVALFEVMEFRSVNDDDEGILTVRSLRGQF